MSETNVNAYKLELAEKEQQKSVIDSDIQRLKKVINSMEPEEAVEPTEEPEEVVEPEEAAPSPRKTGKK